MLGEQLSCALYGFLPQCSIWLDAEVHNQKFDHIFKCNAPIRKVSLAAQFSDADVGSRTNVEMWECYRTGAFGMPMLAKDLQAVRIFNGIFVVSSVDSVRAVLCVSDDLVLLSESKIKI